MEKKWIEKMFKNLMVVLLCFVILLSATVPAVASAEGGSDGDISSVAQDSDRIGAENVESLRSMQADIVEWKRTANGGEQLLAGQLLDGAGDSGSDWFAFDISRMNIEDNQAAYLSRMKDVVEKIYEDIEGNQKSYRFTDIYRMILTIEACGGDPTSFGTDAEGNAINLIHDGIWNCIWGDPGDQGINGYIWALLAVDSKNWEEPEGALWTREKLITQILSRQLADGGFGLDVADTSDVDLTAMAHTALAPYQDSEQSYTFTSVITEEEVTTTVEEAAEKAFVCLSDMQHVDGSMVTYEQRTSESTSWTLVALASWGHDPDTDGQFIKNGNTLLDGLRQFQLEDGGMIHSLDGEEEETTGNNMASYQTVYALEAVCRLREGKCKIFDMSDAPVISQEEIDKAGESLPELTEETQKTGEEAKEDTENRSIIMTACIAGAVVLVVVIFLVLALRDRKKKSNNGPDGSDMDDEEDDEW